MKLLCEQHSKMGRVEAKEKCHQVFIVNNLFICVLEIKHVLENHSFHCNKGGWVTLDPPLCMLLLLTLNYVCP